ncbi:hypothetical protein N0A02_30905 [Paraburkholderia acidicola]|uniref:Uncharacterized protein n=1 Tax=Paraburkholderia acidicola TaxID=1912599 RepID=A0ABV1LX01_9BURK
MKRAFLTLSAALISAAPLLAHAAALDAPLACNESAHRFIADLADQQLIDPKPNRVESNSINAFSPAHGADLTAYGFRVIAIVGFEKDDPMFRNGDGEPVAKSAYGAVVFGGTDKVKAAVTEAGSSAIVHHVAPFVTAIFCKLS